MNIPFSSPLINQEVIDEVNDVLNGTRWLTSGPKVIELEEEIKTITTTDAAICVNSWTSGAMLTLRWFGVGPGDEVIIPSYTYSATALAVLNLGANPVMVDVGDDFTIAVDLIKKSITPRTKVIIPVDLGGKTCDYASIFDIVNLKEIKSLFVPNGASQKKLSRILVLADAAHSIGAESGGQSVGKLADVTVFSFHSVKNITTGEGGAICLNLPNPFVNKDEYSDFKTLSLNGQNKSAFQKNQLGSWKYDIVDQGLKVNMPDICAAIGLAQIRQYKKILLPERKRICDFYNNFFDNFNWAIKPKLESEEFESSYHLYMLRIAGINENDRDGMMQYISNKGVGVNVHYIPMPMMTLFKKLGYRMNDYPNTYKLYANEMTLPVYNDLDEVQLYTVCNTVLDAYKHII